MKSSLDHLDLALDKSTARRDDLKDPSTPHDHRSRVGPARVPLP